MLDAPSFTPSLAASGRRRPPQRANQKNSRRGFFGNPSGRTLRGRRSARRTAPGYRACGYKTASGRPKWLSRDPLGEANGLNLYRYARNNPINWYDWSGLTPAAAAAAFGRAATLAGEEEVAGLGPEDPVADIAAGATIVGGLLWAGYEYFQPAAPLPNVVNAETSKPAGSCPAPQDVAGKTPEEIDQQMKDKGWVDSPTNSGDGTRYANPDVPGEQVRVMPGNPDDPNPVKQGPYVRISTGGQVSPPIPIAGNPAQ